MDKAYKCTCDEDEESQRVTCRDWHEQTTVTTASCRRPQSANHNLIVRSFWEHFFQPDCGEEEMREVTSPFRGRSVLYGNYIISCYVTPALSRDRGRDRGPYLRASRFRMIYSSLTSRCTGSFPYIFPRKTINNHIWVESSDANANACLYRPYRSIYQSLLLLRTVFSRPSRARIKIMSHPWYFRHFLNKVHLPRPVRDIRNTFALHLHFAFAFFLSSRTRMLCLRFLFLSDRTARFFLPRACLACKIRGF